MRLNQYICKGRLRQADLGDSYYPREIQAVIIPPVVNPHRDQSLRQLHEAVWSFQNTTLSMLKEALPEQLEAMSILVNLYRERNTVTTLHTKPLCLGGLGGVYLA